MWTQTWLMLSCLSDHMFGIMTVIRMAMRMKMRMKIVVVALIVIVLFVPSFLIAADIIVHVAWRSYDRPWHLARLVSISNESVWCWMVDWSDLNDDVVHDVMRLFLLSLVMVLMMMVRMLIMLMITLTTMKDDIGLVIRGKLYSTVVELAHTWIISCIIDCLTGCLNAFVSLSFLSMLTLIRKSEVLAIQTVFLD